MKNNSRKGYIKLSALICVVFLYFWFTTNYYSIVQVSGNSMNDYLFDNAICISDNHSDIYNRYDVVIARMNNTTSIKRIVGLPNDTILIKNGVVYINGSPCDRYNFHTEKSGIALNEITLGSDEYFLLGDNREISYDSREYGLFTAEKIKGKIINVLWKGGE